jgi:hypothetical protein
MVTSAGGYVFCQTRACETNHSLAREWNIHPPAAGRKETEQTENNDAEGVY